MSCKLHFSIKKVEIHIFITERDNLLVPSLFLNRSWEKLCKNSDLISSATAIHLQRNHIINYFYVIKEIV